MMTDGALPSRKCKDWIQSFVDYTDHLPSPNVFRKWAAMLTIAAATERQIFVKAMGMKLFPNFYIILVGPPGVGKTVAIQEARNFLTKIRDVRMGDSNISRASFTDALAESKKTMTVLGSNPPFIDYYPLTVYSNELGVLIPTYDDTFLSSLTDIWDNHSYSERKRGNKLHIKIDNPFVNIIAGTTPSDVGTKLPEGAWEQGFTARCLFIYSGETKFTELFPEEKIENVVLKEALENDIKLINNLKGEIKFNAEAAEFLSSWHRTGQDPKPDHPRMQHYLTRRTTHLVKLCVAVSISRSSSLIITKADAQEALAMLIAMELYVPDIFKAISSGGDSKVIEEAWHYVFTLFAKSKEPVPAPRLIDFVRRRVPAHSVARVIEVMTNAGIIKQAVHKGQLHYIPASKAEL